MACLVARIRTWPEPRSAFVTDGTGFAATSFKRVVGAVQHCQAVIMRRFLFARRLRHGQRWVFGTAVVAFDW